MESYPVHPATEKMIKAGHPWITLDKWSGQFPKQFGLIYLHDKNQRNFAVAINDPKHSTIKARLWVSNEKDFNTPFDKLLSSRLDVAIAKRKELIESKRRQNYYLCFGEADQLPGLFILQLDKIILIQYYSDFWEPHLKTLVELIRAQIMVGEFWAQGRSKGQTPPYCLSDKNISSKQFELKEYGVSYHIHLGETYDHGLYTDMSGIRWKVKNQLPLGGRLLNLYSYTGAWSLFALSQGVNEVVSVDLSKTYLQWLENNLALNNYNENQKHQSIEMNVEKALLDMIKREIKFDFIFCDPPSSSSDGNKKTSAIKEYAKLIPLFSQLLSPKGKMLLFLNTHSVSAGKFGNTIAEYLSNSKWSLLGTYGLSEDCPMLKGFPEGNYLKGVLYQKG